VILHAEKKYKEACQVLEQATEIFDAIENETEKHAKTLRLLGNCYISLKQYPKALGCLETAYRLWPERVSLYLLAKANIFSKKDEESTLEIFLRTLRDPDCDLEMGLALLKQAISVEAYNFCLIPLSFFFEGKSSYKKDLAFCQISTHQHLPMGG